MKCIIWFIKIQFGFIMEGINLKHCENSTLEAALDIFWRKVSKECGETRYPNVLDEDSLSKKLETEKFIEKSSDGFVMFNLKEVEFEYAGITTRNIYAFISKSYPVENGFCYRLVCKYDYGITIINDDISCLMEDYMVKIQIIDDKVSLCIGTATKGVR